jgi:hypothetical protein
MSLGAVRVGDDNYHISTRRPCGKTVTTRRRRRRGATNRPGQGQAF